MDEKLSLSKYESKSLHNMENSSLDFNQLSNSHVQKPKVISSSRMLIVQFTLGISHSDPDYCALLASTKAQDSSNCIRKMRYEAF